MTVRSVLVVGTGLIGTSVGLALAAHDVDVFLEDTDPDRVRLAGALGAGRPWAGEEVEHVVIATPPAAVVPVIQRLLRLIPRATFSDVASVKSHLPAEIECSGVDASRFVGGHPMAGRERGGPAAARRDLFRARPWVLTPLAESSTAALGHARAVVELCGAVAVEMSPDEHDAAVALVSHTPQLVASALASLLPGGGRTALGLAGSGLRDTTRIAASDPLLWADVVATNAVPVADHLDQLAQRLAGVASRLRGPRADAAEAVRQLVEAGQAGHALLPGRHNAPATPQGVVQVVVPDAPGELARVLNAAADAGVNVEDITIEHGVGEPLGVIQLVVSAADSAGLAQHLEARGWAVHT